MSDTLKLKPCPKCGEPIPAEALQGLCPKCLLAQASIATETGETVSFRPTPPALAQVAAAFPQLEILELIGQGGMGFVYKARQPKLERFVALKILPQSSPTDSRFAERFTREGRLLARLNHPNIVTIHDFGQSNALFYLLMEYVDGVNLRQAMRAGRFTPDQALAIVPKVCDALQFAHNEGILHRDIKPENILLDAKGRVKIADFGIAKLIGEPRADGHLTGSGGTLGTPHYMAPEQVERPATVDHRADIYSLGVVFYEMLTGELPLGRFQPPSQKVQVDVRLDDVVLQTLEKEPGRRYQHASEVKTAVDTIAANPESPKPAPLPVAAPKSKRGLIIISLVGIAVISVAAANFYKPMLGGWTILLALMVGGVVAIISALAAVFFAVSSLWKSLAARSSGSTGPDVFWKRFALAVASFIAALILIPLTIIFIAMIMPAALKARTAKVRAAAAEAAAKESASSPAPEDTENSGRLFLDKSGFSWMNPEPGQLNWGLKAFVPPNSLATFLFIVWSNGVPTIEPSFSTYFKVGKAGGVDIPSFPITVYRESNSREFSKLDESQRAQFLANLYYPASADANDAVHWNINLLGANYTEIVKAMPAYHRVEGSLPQNVDSGHQFRFPLIEFDRPANSPSNGWSGVDLRIFLEPLRTSPIRMLPNEVQRENYVAGKGLQGSMEEALARITNSPE